MPKFPKLYPIPYTLYPKLGFTLVELLVVISIISITVSAAYVAFQGAQNKGRDARRKQDLKAISATLVSYYQDNGSYPPPCVPSPCTSTVQYASDSGTNWIPNLWTYMQNLPKDPRQSSLNITTTVAQIFKDFLDSAIVSVFAVGNLALNKPVAASSVYSPSFAASLAVDGNSGTRWAAASSDPQWIYVDLGARYSINQVVINWETACAKSYQIQVSDDASSWTSIYATTTGDGGIDTLNISGSGRYVRMYATERCLIWPESLWEFEVYGALISSPPPPPPPPPPGPPPPPPSDCTAKVGVYCYVASADRSSFVLWAQLDNPNDTQAVGKSASVCNLAPPGGNTAWNYCVESPQ